MFYLPSPELELFIESLSPASGRKLPEEKLFSTLLKRRGLKKGQFSRINEVSSPIMKNGRNVDFWRYAFFTSDNLVLFWN